MGKTRRTSFGICLSVETTRNAVSGYQRPGGRSLCLQDQKDNMSQLPSQTQRPSKTSDFINKPPESKPCFGIRRTYSSDHTTLVTAMLPNTVRSCSRHGVAAARLTSERPSNVIPHSKKFILLGYIHCFSHWTFL
jgi:hypothetical protein